MKRIIAVFLSVFLIVSVLLSVSISYNAVTANLSYIFSKSDKGFAEGDILLTANDGTYWLYWADNNKALENYSEICSFTFNYHCTQRHVMHERSAIPAGAVKLIAIKSESEPKNKYVNSADAVFNIPKERQLSHSERDKRYSFASYSDVHCDAVKKNYKYDEIHWRKALDTAADRNAQFIVLSGDYVNNNTSFEGIVVPEWRIYQRVLAESDYSGPVYEAIGNHEIRQDPTAELPLFVNGTGLEGDKSSASNGYFEKTINGDHFLFMSLEKGFRPSKKQEQFSTEQLNWLEGRLMMYSGDGHNIYIIEHALFYKYGAGDRVDDEPFYDIPLYDEASSTKRFKSILEEYKDAVFISGHTHISFDEQYNFSDNNGTSAQMIHNSSIGGVRHIIDNALVSDYKKDESEGYIVDVYDDAIIFNGANVYYNEYNPNWCYIVKPSSVIKGVASADDNTAPETEDVESFYKLGDVNFDNNVNIRDATLIQYHIAKLNSLSQPQIKLADVNQDGKVDVNDVTALQKIMAGIISRSGTAESSEYRNTVKKNLDLYYRYSSYDSYQALKKVYLGYYGDDTLKKYNDKLLKIVDKNNVDKAESMTVYFENTEKWANVYAYNWGDNGSVKASPGTKLSSVGKSKNGNDIYKYTIPDKQYYKFRFSDGTNKTQDIMFYSGNVCYYIYEKTTLLKVKSYKYTG